jgi:hypothetical protein
MVKARALLFGLNYPNSSCKLNGCVQDVLNMADMLVERIPGIQIRMCTDFRNCTETTGRSMIASIKQLAYQSQAENLEFCLIHYSGHGTSVPDTNGDEADGMDECLVPSDYNSNGVITDDVLHELLTKFNRETRVVFVCDACHSGTILDLPFKWNNQKESESVGQLDIPANVLSISGCRDNQTSADAYNVLGDKRYSGALTSCLLQVMKTLDQQDSNNVFKIVKALQIKLAECGFDQVPELLSNYDLAAYPDLLN